MRIFTWIFFLITLVAGFTAFHDTGSDVETWKLLYAYSALTTVVCALVSLAARRPQPSGQN